MDEAIRAISVVIGLIFLGVAVYLAFMGSWTAAILFFVLFGGAEFTAYALGASALPKRKN